MWTCETFAILFTILSIVVIFLLKDKLGGISSSLVVQILVRLILRGQTNYVATEVLVALLLWKNVVFKLNNEINFLLEVFKEAVKLRRQFLF
jgi:hypothetical protein